MIITVTLNPALDQTLEVEHFTEADTNRVVSSRFDIGGKGLNIARVLKELGYEAIAVGFAPGNLGRMIEDQLLDGGIGCDLIYVPGETRTNISVLDRSTHRHTTFATPGPDVSAEAVELFRQRLLRRVRPGAWVALAGSIPPPGDPMVYADVIRAVGASGAFTALDADGPVVAAILDSGARPTVLKMNGMELQRLIDRPLPTEADVFAAARAIHARGVPNVVITRGPAAAVAVTAMGEFLVHTPDVEVQSAAGAGDAFLAGLLLGLLRTGDWPHALQLGASAGTACCLTPGTALCHERDTEALRGQVRVERVLAPSAIF